MSYNSKAETGRAILWALVLLVFGGVVFTELYRRQISSSDAGAEAGAKGLDPPGADGSNGDEETRSTPNNRRPGSISTGTASSIAEDPEDRIPLEVLGTVPPFRFIERSGEEFSLEDLAGRVWVANFIFTQCGSICPMMTVRMGEIQEKVGPDTEGVAYVSFSVDPDRDTPERLSRYAENYGATGDRYFLTGKKTEVYELCTKHFKLGVRDATLQEIERGEDPILHSQRFVLVDRESRIRGYYLGAQKDQIGFLAEDVRTLLAEEDSPEPTTTTGPEPN